MGDLGVSLCFQFKHTCAESFVYAFRGRYMMATFNMQVKVLFLSVSQFTCLSYNSSMIVSSCWGVLVWIELERDRCWPSLLHNMRTSLLQCLKKPQFWWIWMVLSITQLGATNVVFYNSSWPKVAPRNLCIRLRHVHFWVFFFWLRSTRDMIYEHIWDNICVYIILY